MGSFSFVSSVAPEVSWNETFLELYVMKVIRTKLGNRCGFWRKRCQASGKPLATSDVHLRSNGTASKSNIRLLDAIPIVVTEEQVSIMRGDDVCHAYHPECFEELGK